MMQDDGYNNGHFHDDTYVEYTLDERKSLPILDTVGRLATRAFLWYCPSCNRFHAGFLLLGGMKCPFGKDENE